MALNPSSTGSTIKFVDDDCIDFTTTGKGTKSDPLLVKAKLITDGSIKCTPNGLTVALELTGGTNGTDGSPGSPGAGGGTGNNGADGVVEISTDPADCLPLGLTGNGSVLNPLVATGSVKLSQNPANTLVCTTAGLLSIVGLSHTSLSPCIVSTTSGDGSPDNPFALTNDLKINPVADNLICCSTDGLYAGLHYNYSHGNCVDFNISGYGTKAEPLCFHSDVNISTIDNNALSCAPDGLFVPNYQLIASGSSCVTTKLSGTGEFSSPWVLNTDVRCSEQAGNRICCTGGGLYVGADVIIGGNSTCVTSSISGDGTALHPYVVMSALTVRPHVDNGAVCHPEGLFVPDKSNYTFRDTTGLKWTVTGTGTPSDPKIVTPTITIAGGAAGTDGGSGTDGNGNPCVSSGLLYQGNCGLDVRPTNIQIKPGCTGTGAWISLEGAGSVNDPLNICVGTQLDSGSGNLLRITETGLTLTCADICECFTDLFSADPAFQLSNGKVYFSASTDACNQLALGSDGKPFVAPLAVNNSPLNGVVLNVDCATNTLTAAAQLHGSADNNLQLVGGALYSKKLTVADTRTIDLNLSSENLLTANFKLSGQTGNGISDSDGLFVDGTKWGAFELGIHGCAVAGCLFDGAAYVPHDNIHVGSVTWYLRQAPAGSDLTVQVLVNGLTAYTFTAADGTTNNGAGIISLGSGFDIPAGAKVMLNVVSAGVQVPAEDLVLNFKYSW